MFKKIKGYIENRKAKKMLKEQTAQLQFMLLSKLYSVVKVFEGDLDIESVIALAEQLKPVIYNETDKLDRKVLQQVRTEEFREFLHTLLIIP